MLQDTYSQRTSRGHVVEARIEWSERARAYRVRLLVDGKRKAGMTIAHLAEARRVARALVVGRIARLEARPDRRRPFDRRRSVSAYYVDVTPPSPVPGWRRVVREYRCVICGALNIAGCAQGERCPFWEPKLPPANAVRPAGGKRRASK